MNYNMTNNILNQFDNIPDLLNHVGINNLSDKYTVRSSLNLTNSNNVVEKEKYFYLKEKSNDNIDRFLELVKMEGNKFSELITANKGEKNRNTMPKLLESVGYLISCNTNNFDNQLYVNREKVEQKMTIILNKKIKNNLLLIGPPGTGKTTLINQYAYRNKINNIFVVETAKLIGGSKYRGEFEQKIVDVIKFAKQNELILFFDEIHTLISLGHSEGGMSITNILKPYLTNHNMKFIGATTDNEARILLEDPAFKRRFTTLKLNEFTYDEVLKVTEKYFSLFNINRELLQSMDTQLIYNKLDTNLNKQYFPDKWIDFLDYLISYIKYTKSTNIESILEEYIYDQSIND